MAKKKDPAMDMLQLDMQQRDRELAAQLAMHNAEIAFQQKKLEMVDMPGLQAQKDQFALSYALEQAKLDYTKTMGEKTFGESQRQFDLTNSLNQQRLLLDQNAQAFQEKIQTGQLQLNEANVTGFYNGTPTLARMTMEADQTGYLNGQKTMAREQQEFNQGLDTKKFGLSQAQTVLNAPRGPADYSAYLNRLYGLQSTGMVPGIAQQLLSGSPVAQAGTMQGAMPMSNTQFAMGAVYGPQGVPNNVAQSNVAQSNVAQAPGNPREALQAQVQNSPTALAPNLTPEQQAQKQTDEQVAARQGKGDPRSILAAKGFDVGRMTDQDIQGMQAQEASNPGSTALSSTTPPGVTNYQTQGPSSIGGPGAPSANETISNPLQDGFRQWQQTPDANAMFSAAAGGNPTQQSNPSLFQNGVKSGSDVNYRDWQKLSPVTQDFVKGFAEENLGQPAQDFAWGIAQGAPAMQAGAQAKRGLF